MGAQTSTKRSPMHFAIPCSAAIAAAIALYVSSLSGNTWKSENARPSPTPQVFEGGFSTDFEEREWVTPTPTPVIDSGRIPSYLDCDACAAISWQLRAYLYTAEQLQGDRMRGSQLGQRFEEEVCTPPTFAEYSVWEISGAGAYAGPVAAARRVLVGPGTSWEGKRVGTAKPSGISLGEKLAQRWYIFLH